MTPEELKQWRKRYGYSQRSLAEALGVSFVTVARWETGVRQIPVLLSLALEALAARGGERKPRETETKSGGEDDGVHL